MKYFARIGDNEYACVVQAENGALFVEVEGQRYRADLRHIARSDAYSLLLDGRSYEFTLFEGEDFVELSGGAGLFHVLVQDERTHAARSKTAAARGATGPVTLLAVMPGIVRDLMVEPGDRIEKGQALLILEAMKMQNEIRADRTGAIAAVQVAVGDTVEKGAPLLVIE